MRILLICLQDLQLHRIPAYRFWADYFRHGLQEAGHEWVEVPGVDWAQGITPSSRQEQAEWRAETWERTVEFLAREKKQGRPVDCLLSYLYPTQVEPAAVNEIRRLGVPCVNFFCDNVREFTRVPDEFHVFDLHWVPEWEALEMYTRAKLPHCFAPMPAWVAPAARLPVIDELDQVTFIGSADALRRSLLSRAVALGAPVMIGGRGWQNAVEVDASPATAGAETRAGKTIANQIAFLRQHGVRAWTRKSWRRLRPATPAFLPAANLLPEIDDGDYLRLTKGSAVTLGINRVPTFRHSQRCPLRYSRLRDIEAPMMGACYLTEWTAGLDQLYDLGTEVETYRTAEELVAKVEELRSDPVKRQRLRRLGQRRALTDLTIARSIGKVFSALHPTL